jgi:acylpyruvate hydrolase
MKLVMFSYRGQMRLGALVSKNNRNWILDFQHAEPNFPVDMLQFLRAGESAWTLARRAIANLNEDAFIAEADVMRMAPLPCPGKIICVGHNYHDHADTSSGEESPTFFGKFSNTVIAHKQPIVYPNFAIQLDYEAELAVVIGKRAKNVDQARALDFVAGYTIFNDVTARDYQPRSSQWSIRKSFDTFGPMGPALVTADEIPDPGNLDIALTLNGIERQRSNTRHLIFSIPFLIAYLTRTMTLEPGDVISTGTPSGTGASLKPPVFMQPGDEVCARIEKIGELVNPVVAEK